MAKPTDVRGLSARSALATAGPLLLRARLRDALRHGARLERPGAPDPDAVHDLRVALRRLRSALRLLGGPEQVAREPEVKALQDALGVVRDLQVERAWLRGLPPGAVDPAARRALAAWGERSLVRAGGELDRAFRTWRGRTVPSLRRALVGQGGRGRLGGPAVARSVRDQLRRLERRLERARARLTPRRAHRLRVAVKEARYLVELVAPAFAGPAGRTLAELVPLQEGLGELHDTDVRVVRLARRVVAGAAPARSGAASLLRSVRRDRRRRERDLRGALDRWHLARRVRALRRSFRPGRAR